MIPLVFHMLREDYPSADDAIDGVVHDLGIEYAIAYRGKDHHEAWRVRLVDYHNGEPMGLQDEPETRFGLWWLVVESPRALNPHPCG